MLDLAHSQLSSRQRGDVLFDFVCFVLLAPLFPGRLRSHRIDF